MNLSMLHAFPAIALASLALLPQTAATPAVAADATPRPDPVIFVHGWNSDGSTWNTMAARFRSDGWPADRLHQWSYPTAQSNATSASELAEEIDRVLAATGAAKVDLVTHSMGGLSSRYYLKNLGGDRKVDAWVSLAGPNHGTDTAYWCGGASCSEMRPGSTFLQDLNAGDETPGTTRYATWWSACDSIINPDSTVALTGAVNNQTACLQHSAFPTDAAVYKEVKRYVASGDR
ncbi:triacylglycerol lipase [Streptomyces sp. ISL-36]|uniref:esterase/lipase family protein n=1 Tax=Streptomyces sp. ISL-36 TaxID=2819182 RepID=UPI001BE8146A|nr:triacylglycerol lipase [Streptomyces sp. ISL-36]MBT2444993.1 triacylglycerol lipase [Streptomyces sp. ISL-36]